MEDYIEKNNNNISTSKKIICEGATAAIEKLKKYYSKVDNSKIFAISTSKNKKFNFFFKKVFLVLDPRLRIFYFKEQKWEKNIIQDYTKLIQSEYDVSSLKFLLVLII